MRRGIIIGMLAACLVITGALMAGAADRGFLWDGNRWLQASMDGKIGYIWGLGNLADFEVASGGAKAGAVSQALVLEMKHKTVSQVVQEVEKYYQDNPGGMKSSVIEVILHRYQQPKEPATKGEGTKK
jgi:hypothetical protein